MIGRRLLATAVIGVGVSALIPAADGGNGHALAVNRTAEQAPSQAALAKKLAALVTEARTPAARYRALLTVMRTLHVGVFTGNGKAIVREGRPRGIYLYDFELRVMAAALARRDATTAEDLAGRLSAAGVRPGGRPVTAAQLSATLAGGARAARTLPRARLSLVPLLARELGLRHRPAYDLATASADKLRFDALQTFLIGADVAAAAYRLGGRAPNVASRATAGRSPTATAAGPCDGDVKDLVKELMPFGKWGIGLIKSVGTPVKGISVTLDAIHGPLLAFSVDVRSAVGPTGTDTHYGPSGHDPDAGQPLDFRVYVIMLDQIREGVIKCGPLIGVKFPDKGPIPGVRVLWSDPGAVELDNFGTTNYSAQTTDRNGIVDLHFVPKDEKLPGFGGVREARNTKVATVLYQSAFGNVIGTLAQFLTPKQASFPWSVSYHLPRGFKVAGMIHDNDMVQFGKPSGRKDTDIRVCGDDPFAPWTGTVTIVSEGDPLRLNVTWPFVPGVATSPVGYPIVDGRLNLTPPFSAVFTVLSGGGTRKGPYSLPLEEDLSCPDNTP